MVNLTSSDQSSSNNNAFQNLINDLTNTISQDINDGLNFLARDIGLKDFYSLHVLDFCEGYYEPSPLPNATLSRASISQNVTKCSNRTALHDWNPRQELQDDLDNHGFAWLNVTALRWPSAIDDNVNDIKDLFRATFVLYCIAIAFMFVALVLAIAGFFLLGRLWATLNVIADALAFIVITIASALVTAVMQQGSKNITNYGSDVGVEAYGSSKFLALTWVATALMFVASIVWCVTCFTGRRDKTATTGGRRGWRSRRRGSDRVDLVDMKAHR